MSIFNDNITSEPGFMTDGRKWMIDCIDEVCNTYFKLDSYPHYPKLNEKNALMTLIRECWTSSFGNLNRFHIRATSTSVRESKIPGYKYEVSVSVNFDWSDCSTDFIPFVNIPICEL